MWSALFQRKGVFFKANFSETADFTITSFSLRLFRTIKSFLFDRTRAITLELGNGIGVSAVLSCMYNVCGTILL